MKESGVRSKDRAGFGIKLSSIIIRAQSGLTSEDLRDIFQRWGVNTDTTL